MITIKRSIERLSADILQRLCGIPTPAVVDAMGGVGAIEFGIRSLFPASAFVGSAVTVQTPPNDNLAPYAALEVLGEGDVVVINTRNFVAAATVGDTLLTCYKQRGVVAVVLDGLARDLEGLETIGIPVYARGLSPNAPQKNGSGFVGFDVVLGGVHIASGDVVIGDADGVAVIPRDQVMSVLQIVDESTQSRESAPPDRHPLPEWLETFLQSERVRRI